jgi:hypothetical protein
LVSEHDENEERAQAGAGKREEVDGDQVLDVVGKERAPGLGRRGVPLRKSRETVRSATWMSNLKLGIDSRAPQSGGGST